MEIEGPTEPTKGANSAKVPPEAKNMGTGDAKRDGKKSGGRTPGCYEAERGNGTISGASSGEGSSSSEESSSREDITPPKVVLVVPGTGKIYNKHMEAPTPQAGKTTRANNITLAEQNITEGVADKRG